MITVVDAIMGSGKSSAAITYMNEHSDQKFIYITPYLEEGARIKNACPDLNFIEPEANTKSRGSKLVHTHQLIKEGCNITTTHAAFLRYGDDLLDAIRQHHYTLIIDEDVATMQTVPVSKNDLSLLVKAGMIHIDNDGHVTVSEGVVSGTRYDDILSHLKSHSLEFVYWDKTQSATYMLWLTPPEVITAFDDVFVLTYLFKGADLYKMFQIYGIEFSYGGIHRDEDGTYRFTDRVDYIPSYVPHLAEKIHLVDDKSSIDPDRMNLVGRKPKALSSSWFQSMTHRDEVNQLRSNIGNFFNNRYHGIDPACRMWTTYEKYKPLLKGKGYTKGFVPFNARATNNLRHKTHLAYCVNVFLHTWHRNCYQSCGFPVTEEEENQYSLGVLVQWIWRSAIRDGGDIWLYLPSSRMRGLLKDWMNSLREGV